ncbi:UDP-N-acetylmuramoyl-tripeptide--D-alanyl-D-alanine ligase [bacterium]|nr:UDP-N-acetylmuramoyl-tripeptide--D-alanyl-D-alanine ligase [bacterium]
MSQGKWMIHTLEGCGLLNNWKGAGDPERLRACIDTRALEKGDCFFALAGEQADGHHFARKALEQGASAVLLSQEDYFKELSGEFPQALILNVDDVLVSLQELASAWVGEMQAKLVGVTGSNGKTGTKIFCAAALSVLGATEASRGNLNNLIGLPMSTLGLPMETEFLVAEMGCSSFGEIARLAELFQPEAGIITNIGEAHLEVLGDKDGVAKAKGELAAALPKDGLLLLWEEDPYVSTLTSFCHPRTKVRTFGFSDASDLQLEDLGPMGPGRRMHVEGYELTLASPMRHSILQAGAAWLLAREYGAEPADLVEALSAARPEGNRSSLYQLGAWTVMDDSYNANPDSLRAALNWLSEYPAQGKRWAILGDMLEMGPRGPEVHLEIGREVAAMGNIEMMNYGSMAGAMAELAGHRSFANHEDLASVLLTELAEGDLLLVKGSRGMAMEKVIEALESATGNSREALRFVL